MPQTLMDVLENIEEVLNERGVRDFAFQQNVTETYVRLIVEWRQGQSAAKHKLERLVSRASAKASVLDELAAMADLMCDEIRVMGKE